FRRSARSSNRSRYSESRSMRRLTRSREESRGDAVPEPPQVMGQPLPQPEPALPRGAIAPSRRHLTHREAQAVRFHGELQRELEPGHALDVHAIEEIPRVQLVVARRIVDRHSGDGMQQQTREPAEAALHEGTALLRSASNVAT